MSDRFNSDYLVIGSGVAGLRAALELASHAEVALVTKRGIMNGSTHLAQGGISAVDPARHDDSFALHTDDTLAAADGIGDRAVTERFTASAYEQVIKYMLNEGVAFTKSHSGAYPYELHQEGGHSRPRIYCVDDQTGFAVEKTLCQKVREHPNITVYENHHAIDLVTTRKTGLDLENHCLGAYVFNNDRVTTFGAKATFIATGGAGRIFLYTSNDSVSTGDGIAMAYRAGAKIANMEFTQFHPTVLYGHAEEGRSFLLTEALRGKNIGGILTIAKSGPLSKKDLALQYTPDGSAGTRDVVARAIDTEMKKGDLAHVYLNVTTEVTGTSPEELQRLFPKIWEKMKSIGIDMAKQPIPVVPASHYTCGGIVVGENSEVPGIDGLYAIGECSYTGLMGANRLASNSLSEAALYGMLAAKHAEAMQFRTPPTLPLWDVGTATESRAKDLVSLYWDELRRTMWHLVGIVRDEQRLAMASDRVRMMGREINSYYWNYHITPDFLELRNIADVARLTIDAAAWRKESRGGHFRHDYPQTLVEFEKNSVQSLDKPLVP